MVHPTERFERNPEVLHRKMREELILLPIKARKETSRQFYFFEEVGERIWELLDGNRDCQKIVETVALEFGARKEKISGDILDFLSELAKEGLIRRRP